MSQPRFAYALSCLSVVAGSLLTAACASTPGVTATDKPDVYAVAASARGARMSWAGAYRTAVETANDYCAQRGMQASMVEDFVEGGHELQKQQAALTFRCHPTF